MGAGVRGLVMERKCITMRRLCIWLCLLLLLLTCQAQAAERTPLKVARVPIVVASYQAPGRETLGSLEQQVGRALHVPLNGTLHAVEFLPEREVRAAFEDARQGPSRKWRDLVRPMAERLGADLVVLPVLTGYEQYERMSWNWNRGTIVYSYASWELCIYDARTDEVVRKQASRVFNDEYSAAGEVSVLARTALDAVLRESGLHEKVIAGLRQQRD